MSLSKNQKEFHAYLKKKNKWGKQNKKTEHRAGVSNNYICKNYARNIEQLISICLGLGFFFSISVLILKSFPRRCLLKHSFVGLFSPRPLEEVEWRWQKPNDDFKMTDNIIPYYYCLVDCQRTNVLQTSNVINSERQIWITNPQYMCGFSRKKKIWSGAEKYLFA